jgi:hypothetical protein
VSTLVASAGTQFITGACTSDADCASSCCGFNSGLCAGPVVAQQRDGGCGHGDAVPNDTAAVALGFTGAVGTGASTAKATTAATVPAATSAAKAAGTQFITGACTSDADCASACCGFNSGLCAGPVVAQQRDGGCGHGDAVPNDTAAVALGFTGAVGTGASTGASAKAAVVAPTKAAAVAAVSSSAATSSVKAAGTQFITGACTSDADCASACCGFNSGLCAGPVVAQQRDGGCGHGNATPNDNAAVALGFTGTVGKGASTTLATSVVAAATAVAASKSSGTQFITGTCASDSDCADGCCGFNSGKYPYLNLSKR